MCFKGGSARVSHRDLSARPRACLLDRLTRALVARTRLLEKLKHMLGASRGPDSKQPMVSILKSAAATHSDKTWVAVPLVIHEASVPTAAFKHCHRGRAPAS